MGGCVGVFCARVGDAGGICGVRVFVCVCVFAVCCRRRAAVEPKKASRRGSRAAVRFESDTALFDGPVSDD